MAKSFVPLLVDVDKDSATAEAFSIQSLPTMVIADAGGAETIRFVGAPFKGDVESAVKWLEAAPGRLAAIDETLKVFGESKHTNIETGEKLVALYLELGAKGKVVWVYEQLISALGADHAKNGELHLKAGLAAAEAWDMEKTSEHLTVALEKLPKDDPRRTDASLKLLPVKLMGGDVEGVRKEAKEMYDTLRKAKDARAVEAGLQLVQANVFYEEDEAKRAEAAKAGRATLLEIRKEFPDSRATELRFYAAYMAWMASEKDTARKEMKELSGATPADQWTEAAKGILESEMQEEDQG